MGKMGPGFHRGGKPPNKGLICLGLLVPVTFMQYAVGSEKKHFLDCCGRKQQKQRLLIKTTRAVVYMYSFVCVFISQYTNKVDFIFMGEAEITAKGTVPNFVCLGVATVYYVTMTVLCMYIRHTQLGLHRI